MRKIVVADDESWIRRGIIQLIPWERWGLELAGEAEDGEEAFAMAMEIRPDILFLDMRMPEWDGRTLLRMFHEQLPDMIVIVVSGYSDFEYTKQAIRYRAFEYIVKPVKEKELLTALDKALQELEQRDSPHIPPELWLRQQVAGLHVPSETNGGIGGNDELATVAKTVGVIQADDYPYACDHPMPQLFADMLKQTVPFYPDLADGWTVIESEESEEEAIFMYSGQADAQALSSLFEAVLDRLRQAYATASIGVSKPVLDPSLLREAYMQARYALSGKPVSKRMCVRFAAGTHEETTYVYPQEEEHQFLTALQSRNGEASQAALSGFFQALDRDDVSVEAMRRAIAMFVHSVDKWLGLYNCNLRDVCGHDSPTLAERFRNRNEPWSVQRELLALWFPALTDFFLTMDSLEGDQIGKEAVRQIERYYYLPLSLQEMAGQHHVNADYLGRLIKKVTGKNFVEYLTDLRLHKSKDLIRSSHYKNYEIAAMVGYEDYRYFSQVFKRKLGMTIGEYREQLAKDKQEHHPRTTDSGRQGGKP